MKAWAISDTHTYHRLAIVPDKIDLFIHAGDSTDYQIMHNGPMEFEDFYNWISNLSIKHRVIIPGNHDYWALKTYNRDKLKEAGVIYLEHEYFDLEGLKIFGSPYTPTFGNWCFMKDRGKLDPYWRHLDGDIDILITHGPPAGILDLTENRDYQLEQVGDLSLYKRVMEKKPKYHIFGHVHNFKSCRNQGMFQYINHPTKFMNVSAVEDGRFDKGLISNGIVFEI